MMPEIVKIKIKLLSPAIVTTRRTQRGFVKPADHIPGSMLRGAILSALYREGKLKWDDIKKEAESPTLLASPAYPLYQGARSLPAVPSIRQCDECKGYEYISLAEEQFEERYHKCKDRPENLHGLSGAGEQRRVRSVWLLKTLHGSLLANVNGGLVEVRTKTFRATSVAIDKRRRAAARGMLFDYEAIAEGTEFWAWVSVPEKVELDGLEVAVGRGQSRGFGLARVSVWSGPEPGFDYNPEGSWFVAISPVTLAKKLEWKGLSITLEEVRGRTYSAQTGWDFVQGRLRPFVEVARRGSMVLARLSDAGYIHVLRVGIPVKVDAFWLTGLNALIPLSEYESILGVNRRP